MFRVTVTGLRDDSLGIGSHLEVWKNAKETDKEMGWGRRKEGFERN